MNNLPQFELSWTQAIATLALAGAIWPNQRRRELR